MKKIFLICPVRQVIYDVTRARKIENYIKKLEESGYQVHWPLRDTDQNDPIGLRICKNNCERIFEADEVHVWWDENSRGSLFDLGMTFICYLYKGTKIILANPDEIKSTKEKSFNNVLLELHKKKEVSNVVSFLPSC